MEESIMFDPSILAEIISDSIDMELPNVVHRHIRLPEIPNMANIVIGMRRSGKTWLFYQEMQRLLESGVERSQLLYLNLEDERLLGMEVSDMRYILDTYHRLFPEHLDRRSYLFLDEIQCIDGWESFIRRVLDSENIRVYITGSSSKMLSQDLATSMRGRCVESTVLPYSFREFLAARGVATPPQLERVSKGVRARLEHETLQYIELGGFPALTHIESIDRPQILQSYVDTVIFRDLVERHGLSNTLALKHLIKRLLSDVAEKFSVNRFFNDIKSQGISCGKATLLGYLDHLQEAFLVFPVAIESNSEKRKQVNPKKIYAIDTGLARSYTTKRTRDLGHLLENVVFLELKRRGHHISYHVTSRGREIDFATYSGTRRQLIQVSTEICQESTRQRELAPFEACRDEEADRILITLNQQETIQHPNGTIQVIPAWRWLLGSD
jgi:predicted AAA+ superfamily ATPase